VGRNLASSGSLHERIEVVYEDMDLIVIEKASGVITYPVDSHERDSAIQLVRHYWKAVGNRSEHLYLLHRLDKETSGLLVFAKTTRARESLSTQFEEHTIVREYFAVTEGIPSKKEGTMRATLGRDKRGKRSVVFKGKTAVTHLEVVIENSRRNRALVRCRLQTGRTHQIRIHLAHVGTPVIGDPVYGAGGGGRLALHAAALGFLHPRTQHPMVFRSSLPPSIKALL
jgi:23S rRNA pseudouridine1911/1915/1917 synthase